jgi:hypothetical protein
MRLFSGQTPADFTKFRPWTPRHPMTYVPELEDDFFGSRQMLPPFFREFHDQADKVEKRYY